MLKIVSAFKDLQKKVDQHIEDDKKMLKRVEDLEAAIKQLDSVKKSSMGSKPTKK